jgi:hypothetical protein
MSNNAIWESTENDWKDLPETPVIIFQTSGLGGGNASHGSWAHLKINFEGGSYRVEAAADYPADHIYETDSPNNVIITARGDWEIQGFAERLVELGDKLRPLVLMRKMEQIKNKDTSGG